MQYTCSTRQTDKRTLFLYNFRKTHYCTERKHCTSDQDTLCLLSLIDDPFKILKKIHKAFNLNGISSFKNKK